MQFCNLEVTDLLQVESKVDLANIFQNDLLQSARSHLPQEADEQETTV